MGIPKDKGVKLYNLATPGNPYAMTPLGQLYKSPPSPIPGDLGRGPSHQSHVLEHKDTYGQDRVIMGFSICGAKAPPLTARQTVQVRCLFV